MYKLLSVTLILSSQTPQMVLTVSANSLYPISLGIAHVTLKSNTNVISSRKLRTYQHDWDNAFLSVYLQHSSAPKHNMQFTL